MVAKQVNQILARYSDGIIIFFFPILLALLNSNWIFTPATDFLPDPWFYLGYFRYFYAYAPAFPSNIHYFVERLTWIVPGFYVYQLFPPLQANYVLHLSVCYIALFSLYGTLRILFNRRTALLSALLLGSYPWFLRSVGWDNIDGIGITYMLLLIYILTLASRSERWKFHFLCLAGIIHASLVITNLFWIGFAPSWGIYFLSMGYPASKDRLRKLLGEASCFLIGNLILVGVVAIFYHSITGGYNFLKHSLAFSGRLAHDVELIKILGVLYGRMPPYWQVLPILVAIGSILRLSKIKQDIHRHSFIAVTLLFIFAYGWLIFWHFYGLPYLFVFLYSAFVIPAIFLLLGALLATIVDRFSDKDFNIITIIAILVLATPYRLIVISPDLKSWGGNLFLILLIGLIFLVCISLPEKRAFLVPILIIFSTLSFLVGSNAYVFLSDPLKGERNFAAIIDASNTIDSYYYPDRTYTNPRLWFREDENYNTFFDLASLYLYPWGSTIGAPFSGQAHPAVLFFSKLDGLKDGDNIVIVTSNQNTNSILVEASRALARRHGTLTLEKSKEIQEDSLRFTLYFIKIKVAANK